MKPSRTWIASAILVMVMLAIAIWIYPSLPAQAPSHWNAQGQVDGWVPKFWAAAFPVVVLAGIAVLTPLLPLISPRKFQITPFVRTYVLLMVVIQAALLVIFAAALLAGAGYQVPVATIVPLVVGVLLIVLGDYMGKLRKNFFIGIRTPWTLASDAVWERTHRFGGWVFIAGGLAFVVIALTNTSATALAAVIACMVVIPVVYSYFAYRRLEAHPRSHGRGT